ncbi:MAG: hypothetical protein HKO77_01460 [Gemmatimonadetes bacterium]|nr:hypothetical protein [Gemmatimonadota bacterium]
MIFAVTKKSAGARPLTALVAALAFGACAGENLFTAAAIGEPTTVTILEPADGSSIRQGDNLTVVAEFNVQSGQADIEYKVVDPDSDELAFQTEEATLTSNIIIELEAILVPAANQEAGAALVIVTATEAAGETADTVSITITAANE